MKTTLCNITTLVTCIIFSPIYLHTKFKIYILSSKHLLHKNKKNNSEMTIPYGREIFI
jgi:hypothetical protein